MARLNEIYRASPDLWSRLRAIRGLPTIPRVLLEVQELLLDGSSDSDVLAETLSQDQALTAKLLKLVNSAYYGFHRQITSVHQAIVLVGYEEVRGLACAFSVMDAWGPHGGKAFDRSAFWEHSLATARMTHALSREISHLPPESDPFVGGLLHDIGKVVFDHAFPVEFDAAVTMARRDHIPLRDAEIRVFGAPHEAVGAWFLDSWNLPVDLIDGVRWHHDPRETSSSPVLPALIHVSNVASHRFGPGHSGNPMPDDQVDSSLDLLGLSASAIEDAASIFGTRRTPVV